MDGIIIWAHSYCRSTLGFYRGLGNAFGVPIKIILFIRTCNNRKSIGFSDSEFSNLDIIYYDDLENPRNVIDHYKDWNHLFGVYQQDNGSRELLNYAKTCGCRVAIISEAPCNMDKMPRRFIKDIYLHFILPRKVKQVVKDADFIVNLSGNENWRLEKIGWPSSKIISCGYYPPPIIGSNLVKRDNHNFENFTILLSGMHQWHRSPLLLLKALKLLKENGLTPKCYITQKGPLLKQMMDYASNNKLLNVEFTGFVEMSKLIKLYETCSVYIGAGNYEPWGMRLNDVLQCGAPLIVNKGMGGYKLIEDYNCGLTFDMHDYKGLANNIRMMMTCKELYLKKAENAYLAATCITPEKKSREIAEIIHKLYNNW